MKKLLIVTAMISWLFICCNNSHNNSNLSKAPYNNVHDTIFRIKSISDTIGILNICFSSIKIIKQKIIVWKPTTDDFFNMPISNDGMCHTKIDTIINFQPKKYLIVFRTNAYYNDDKVIDCHVCSPVYGIATIEKEDSSYTIKNFKKNLIAAGSFGNGYDTLAIEKFGRDFQLLKIASSYVGNSTVTNTNTYFELENFQKVFSYYPYRSVGDSSKVDPDLDYSEIQQLLIHIKSVHNQDRDDIKLDGYKTFFDKKTHKITKVKQTEFYRSNDFGDYLRYLN